MHGVKVLTGLSLLLALLACGDSSELRLVADAGTDQNVGTGSVVTLDGSRSDDAGGGQITYAWHFVNVPAGSAATLAYAETVMPMFVADLDGVYEIALTVTSLEQGGSFVMRPASASDLVVVTAASGNVAPMAVAGPAQNVLAGSVVTLDGSASSDANGDALTYAWAFSTLPAGSVAVLADADTAGPSFTADLAGRYEITLVVSDGAVASGTDRIIVNAVTGNAAPVAHAGPDQTGVAGEAVVLDGSGSSDANGDPLTWRWRFVSRPAGSAAVLPDPASDTPSFTPDLAGSYVLQLVVSDGQVASAGDNVVVTALQAIFREGFEEDAGGFVASSLWQWGSPVTWPASCPSGVNCWGTNLTGDYPNSISATLLSPEIDLTASAPGSPLRLVWQQAWALEASWWDSCMLQVLEDGVPIALLWAHSEGTIQQDWSGLAADLSVAAGKVVQLRWTITTDSSVTYAGVYLDDLVILARR